MTPAQPQLAPEMQEKLFAQARAVMQNAYAPYSDFLVGAALLTESGEIFAGCNVENASYGLTNCAERTAIFSAVAKLGPKMRIRAVAVVNRAGIACSPCGACRQVLFEFGPEADIFFQGPDGVMHARAAELLPAGFKLKPIE